MVETHILVIRAQWLLWGNRNIVQDSFNHSKNSRKLGFFYNCVARAVSQQPRNFVKRRITDFEEVTQSERRQRKKKKAIEKSKTNKFNLSLYVFLQFTRSTSERINLKINQSWVWNFRSLTMYDSNPSEPPMKSVKKSTQSSFTTSFKRSLEK